MRIGGGREVEIAAELGGEFAVVGAGTGLDVHAIAVGREGLGDGVIGEAEFSGELAAGEAEEVAREEEGQVSRAGDGVGAVAAGDLGAGDVAAVGDGVEDLVEGGQWDAALGGVGEDAFHEVGGAKVQGGAGGVPGGDVVHWRGGHSRGRRGGGVVFHGVEAVWEWTAWTAWTEERGSSGASPSRDLMACSRSARVAKG